MSETLDRFREILIQHSRSPRNLGELPPPAHQGFCSNPLCGDTVLVSLSVEEGQIQELKIKVSGCSISTASASLMSELVQGLSVREAESRRESFNHAISQPEGSLWPEELGSLLPLSHLRTNPSRIPCSLIGWLALKKALSETLLKEPTNSILKI